MLSFFVCVIFLMNIFVVSAFDCGDDFTVTHTAGDVAPVTIEITYGTVMTDLSGENMCWITQNLGAVNQASSATDDTEASAGWYWQFNRKQGYKHDGSTRTPSSAWITNINEDSDWAATNDPCIIELGAGWRLPTSPEWANADQAGAWANFSDTFDSDLKLHASGYLEASNGALASRGGIGIYESNTQNTNTAGYSMYFGSGYSVAPQSLDKIYGMSVRCISDGASSTITYSNFTSEETTNFSAVDLTNVTNLTLAITGKGKIKFPLTHSINAENEDYDLNVKIEDSLIFVNSSALHSSFNSSATLTFYNIDCNKPYVFYSETASTFAAILSENQRCPESLCTNILCADSTLTVDVEHFTGFAGGTDANLTTEAEAGVFYPLDSIEFTAEYINSTDGTPISGECNITFDDEGTWHTMDFNSPDYNYTKSFATSGLHEYNVTCSSANFVTLEANDTKLVSSVEIPEFSIITLGFGLIAVLIGLVVMRKKR